MSVYKSVVFGKWGDASLSFDLANIGLRVTWEDLGYHEWVFQVGPLRLYFTYWPKSTRNEE